MTTLSIFHYLLGIIGMYTFISDLADSFYEDGLSDLLRTLTPLGGAGLIADFQATYALNYLCDILYAHSVQSYCQGFYEYFHHWTLLLNQADQVPYFQMALTCVGSCCLGNQQQPALAPKSCVYQGLGRWILLWQCSNLDQADCHIEVLKTQYEGINFK